MRNSNIRTIHEANDGVSGADACFAKYISEYKGRTEIV